MPRLKKINQFDLFFWDKEKRDKIAKQQKSIRGS
ncbi:hypothetical protein NIES298_03500 [Microcystis aeruginosa NIES-298]|nr:hypothetical protein NIES298_03500 [Microcystis aeruginosa NIES-298]